MVATIITLIVATDPAAVGATGKAGPAAELEAGAMPRSRGQPGAGGIGCQGSPERLASPERAGSAGRAVRNGWPAGSGGMGWQGGAGTAGPSERVGSAARAAPERLPSPGAGGIGC